MGDLLTDPIRFANNTGALVQQDQYGVDQELLYRDADNGLCIGSNDPRETNLFPNPINLFRPHYDIKFFAPTLPPELTFNATGGASYVLWNRIGILRSGGAVLGSCAEFKALNIGVPVIPGQRAWFFLEPHANGNQKIEFGWESSISNLKFTRTDGNAVGNWGVSANIGGNNQTYTTDIVGGTLRKIFIIQIDAGLIAKFFIGNAMNEPILKATMQLPSNTDVLYPFARIASHEAVINRELNISNMYGVLIA